MTAVNGVTGSIQLNTRVGDAVFATVLDIVVVHAGPWDINVP